MTATDKNDLRRSLDELPPFLTQRQLAKSLGCSVSTIRNLIAAGKMPKPRFRVGRGLRWPKKTIQRWLLENAK